MIRRRGYYSRFRRSTFATARTWKFPSRVSEIRDDASIRVGREAVSIVTRRVEVRARRVRVRFGADARETR